MHFTVGDIVFPREDLTDDEKHNYPGWNSSMENLIGKPCIISDIVEQYSSFVVHLRLEEDPSIQSVMSYDWIENRGEASKEELLESKFQLQDKVILVATEVDLDPYSKHAPADKLGYIGQIKYIRQPKKGEFVYRLQLEDATTGYISEKWLRKTTSEVPDDRKSAFKSGELVCWTNEAPEETREKLGDGPFRIACISGANQESVFVYDIEKPNGGFWKPESFFKKYSDVKDIRSAS